VIGCRFEVNHIGIRTGTDPSGGARPSSAFVAQANQFERCDTSIYLRDTSGLVAANGDSGNVNVAGTGSRDHGFRVMGDCFGLVLSGNQCGGECKVGFSLSSNELFNAWGITLVGCYASNNGTRFDLSARDRAGAVIAVVGCATPTGPVS